jgi:hypothetical protein
VKYQDFGYRNTSFTTGGHGGITWKEKIQDFTGLELCNLNEFAEIFRKIHQNLVNYHGFQLNQLPILGRWWTKATLL